MTIGELRQAIAAIADELEIEIMTRYEDSDGDEVEHPFVLVEVGTAMDADTATELARFKCVEYASEL